MEASVAATTRHVPEEYPTIQAAVDASAPSGDSVLVEPGVYPEDVIVRGKVLAIAGEGDAKQITVGALAWTRDGTSSGGGFARLTVQGPTAIDVYDESFLVADSILRGGSSAWFGGRGERAAPRTLQLSFVRCLFEGDLVAEIRTDDLGFSVDDCTFDAASLGIRSGSGGARVHGCTLRGGSGISSLVGNAGVEIEGNEITGASAGITARALERGSISVERNVVWDCGEGVRITGFDAAWLDQNTVLECAGAGILVTATNAVPLDANVHRNLVVSCGIGVTLPAGNAVGLGIECNDVWKNELDWSGVPDPTGIDGNLSQDPLFCDRRAGLFGLRPRSPCLPGASACGQIGALGRGCRGPSLSTPGREARSLEVLAAPNPTRGAVSFTLEGSRAGISHAVLRIFDAGGRLVRREDIPGMSASVQWDGRTDAGQNAAPGIYYYTVGGGELDARGRIDLIR